MKEEKVELSVLADRVCFRQNEIFGRNRFESVELSSSDVWFLPFWAKRNLISGM